MNELSTMTKQLPDTLEDLTQFVLVGKAKLQAYMLKLQTVNKLSVAQEIRDQTLKETQEISNALIAAEQRIGELLLAIPKASGQYAESENRPASKSTIVSDMGYSKDEASDYQQMAKHPEVVQKVIDDALANGDVVTKASVMREIKFYKDRIRTLESQGAVPDDYKEVKAKARAYDSDTNRLNQQLEKAYRQRNELQERIAELEEQTAREKTNNDFVAGAIYFVAQCGSFIRDVGGYVWIADRLADLPQKDREGYVKAAMAVRDWANVLLQNIERSDYGRNEIERISNQGGKK